MEEYRQITISEWMEYNQALRSALTDTAQSYIRVGYWLRKIKEDHAYEAGGYKSIADYAKQEFNLGQSAVSRFMAMNAKYSVDGFSEKIAPDYVGFGPSKLGDMLTLPDQYMDMIDAETPREAIREMKRFDKAAQEVIEETTEQTKWDGEKVLKSFCEANLADFEDYWNGEHTGHRLCKCMNPNGSRTHKKGIWFLLMTERDVKLKLFAGDTTTMSWDDLAEKAELYCADLIEETAAEKAMEVEDVSEKTEADIGIREEVPQVVQGEHEETGRDHGREGSDGVRSVRIFSPVGGESEESTEYGGLVNDDLEKEQMEPSDFMPAPLPPAEEPPAPVEAEPSKNLEASPEEYAPAHEPIEVEAKITMSRWEYIKTLTEKQVALYLCNEVRNGRLNGGMLSRGQWKERTVEWLEWLTAMVAEDGSPAE